MRRPLIWLLLVLCPVLCAAQARLGEVTNVRPQVKGGRAGADETRYPALKKKDPVRDQMRVVTGKRAGTEILLEVPQGKTGTVKMGGNTNLTFYKGLAEGALTFEVIRGLFLATMLPDSRDGEDLITIKTPSGTLKLRGTSVFLDVAQDGSTLLFVLEGSVTVEPQAGGTSVTVKQGEQTSIAPGQPPTPPVPFNVSPGGGPDLRSVSEAVILEPPRIVLDDPRLNLPK